MSALEFILHPTLEEFGKVRNFADGPFVRDAYYGFISDNIFLARCEGGIVGWLTYSRREIYVELENIYVNPNYRRKKVGTFLMEKATEYFIQRGICVLEINAVSPEGRAHARSLGFSFVEENNTWHNDYTRYMKILCPYRRQSRMANNMLCIWKKDYYMTKPYKDPDMSWSLGNSKLPIIFRCKPYDWTAAIVINGKIVKQELIQNLLNTTSMYVRLETKGTEVLLWEPGFMKGIQYTH